jgi:hypothetical protein
MLCYVPTTFFPDETCTLTHRNPYPWLGVWVSMGKGMGEAESTLGLPVTIPSTVMDDGGG